MQLTSTTIRFSSKRAHVVINNSVPCPYSKCSAVVVLTNEQPVQRLCPWVSVVWPPLTLVQIFFPILVWPTLQASLLSPLWLASSRVSPKWRLPLVQLCSSILQLAPLSMAIMDDKRGGTNTHHFPPIQNLWRMLFMHWILYPFIYLYRVWGCGHPSTNIIHDRRFPHCRVTNRILLSIALINHPLYIHGDAGAFIVMDVKWMKLCGSICHGHSLHCKA